MKGKKPGATEHIRFFTLRALKEMLRCHGFKIKHAQGAYVNSSYYLPQMWLSPLVLPIETPEINRLEGAWTPMPGDLPRNLTGRS